MTKNTFPNITSVKEFTKIYVLRFLLGNTNYYYGEYTIGDEIAIATKVTCTYLGPFSCLLPKYVFYVVIVCYMFCMWSGNVFANKESDQLFVKVQ